MQHYDDDDSDEVAYPPWNFSWVIDGVLAAMAWPQSEANMRYIVQQGIKHLVTLSPEKRPPLYAARELQWTEIPIKEFEAPNVKQIRKFIEICQRSQLKNEPLGIHCRQGRGRCGVMLSCYLVHYYNQAPERAIINIRLKRPGSVETYEQEKAVVCYHDCIRGVKNTFE